MSSYILLAHLQAVAGKDLMTDDHMISLAKELPISFII